MLRLRGSIPRETKWDVVVDLFFYRDPEEAEKEEQAQKEQVAVKPEVNNKVRIFFQFLIIFKDLYVTENYILFFIALECRFLFANVYFCSRARRLQ